MRELNALMHDGGGVKGEPSEGEPLLSTTSGGWNWDDTRGGWLDSTLVANARREELEYIRGHAVHERVLRAACWEETGKAPINTGWADTNKGTEQDPLVRSRWVAKEYNTGPRPDLFAGTAPLEGVNMVISEAASATDTTTCVGVVDARRAHTT